MDGRIQRGLFLLAYRCSAVLYVVASIMDWEEFDTPVINSSDYNLQVYRKKIKNFRNLSDVCADV